MRKINYKDYWELRSALCFPKECHCDKKTKKSIRHSDKFWRHVPKAKQYYIYEELAKKEYKTNSKIDLLPFKYAYDD